MTVLNTYRFERRVVYWEEEVVEAESLTKAWEKIESGDVEEVNLGDFDDYFDDEHTLVEEHINDPLVHMIKKYSETEQFEFNFVYLED